MADTYNHAEPYKRYHGDDYQPALAALHETTNQLSKAVDGAAPGEVAAGLLAQARQVHHDLLLLQEIDRVSLEQREYKQIMDDLEILARLMARLEGGAPAA